MRGLFVPLAACSVAVLSKSAEALKVSPHKFLDVSLSIPDASSFVQWGSPYTTIEYTVDNQGNIRSEFWHDERVMQDYMEDVCQKAQDEKCASGATDFCNVDMTYRWFNNSNRSDYMHCAPKSLLRPGEQMDCLDDCSRSISCEGNVGPTDSPLDREVLAVRRAQHMFKTCSQEFRTIGDVRGRSFLQIILDDTCTNIIYRDICNKHERTEFCGQESVARMDGKNIWRCHLAHSLAHNEPANCVDDCGEIVECSGTVPAKHPMAATGGKFYASRPEELITVIDNLKVHTCHKK